MAAKIKSNLSKYIKISNLYLYLTDAGKEITDKLIAVAAISACLYWFWAI